MYRKFIILKSIIVPLVLSIDVISFAQSNRVELFAAYDSALHNTELIPIQMKLTDQANESVTQARGEMLPIITASYIHTLQQVPSSIRGTPLEKAFPANTMSTQINITQPLFQGFKEYTNIRIAKENLRNNQLLTEQARITIFQSVALAYFNVLASEKDKENLEESLKQHLIRMKELNELYRIGRSRIGDIQLEQSNIATLKAQIESDKAVISQARFQFANVTNLDPQTALDRNAIHLPKKIRPLDVYLSDIEHRPDLAVLRSQIKIAKENISVAESSHYPTASLFGNLYPARTGSLHGSYWDVGIKIELPIYSGGITRSQVRQAMLSVNIAELTLSQSLSDIESSVRTLHSAVSNGIAESNAYTEAAKAAEANYKTQVHDFKLGLVTNLDVIDAMTRYLSTLQTLDKTTYLTLYSYAQLRSSTGKVPSDLADEI